MIQKNEICEECQASSSQLSQLFNDDFTSYAVKSTVQRLVCRSAGKAHKACNVMVASMIPDLMTEMRDIFAEKEMLCANMGFCSSAKASVFKPTVPQQSLSDLWKSMGVVKTSNGEELMSCFECKMGVDTLLEEFINKRVSSQKNQVTISLFQQATADDIQKIACGKMVANWTAGCNDFVHMYMSTVLYLTYNQFDAKAICTMMHDCEKSTALSEMALPERAKLGCANCAAVENFFAVNHESLHAHAVSAFSAKVCEQLPSSLGPMVTWSFSSILMMFYIPVQPLGRASVSQDLLTCRPTRQQRSDVLAGLSKYLKDLSNFG